MRNLDVPESNFGLNHPIRDPCYLWDFIAWVVCFVLSIGLFVLVLGCACEVFLGVLLPVSFAVLGSGIGC